MGISPYTDQWILDKAPVNSVVVSSRARLARNLQNIPFAPWASDQQLESVAQQVDLSFNSQQALGPYVRLEMAQTSPVERSLLRESHLISPELEKARPHRVVFLRPEMDCSVMVNEEDHLRMASLISGLRLKEALERICELEQALEGPLDFAFTNEQGYLTACPTNVGTGLRLSVMVHLPGLVMLGQAEQVLSSIGHYGLTVRGAYGEHSKNLGELYQISNEVTLGKTEEQLLEILERVIAKIIEHELHARDRLCNELKVKIQDDVYRALGLLSMARQMDSTEAVTLLSRLRLGIGRNWEGIDLDHAQLSQLFVKVQPAHLQTQQDHPLSAQQRDEERARFLRVYFGGQQGQEKPG